MNELDPDLKRLLKWARAASPWKSEQVPFGFLGRVLACGKEAPVSTLFQQLHRTAWGLSCVALGLILCGALVLISQRSSPASTEEFSLALSFLASNLPR
jgi:hypothetical protein